MFLEPECGHKTPFPAGSKESVGGKRKRVDEGEGMGKRAKKPKSSHSEEPIIISESPSSESTGLQTTDSVTAGRGQRRRSLRHKQSEAEHKPKALNTPENIKSDTVIILDSPSSETECTEGKS